MSRLTLIDNDFVNIGDDDCGSDNLCQICEKKISDCEFISDALKKLAHYEDLEEQGRLIELHCKVGDTVYRINNKIIKMTVDSVLTKNSNRGLVIRIDCIENEFKGENSYKKDDFGSKVFFTKSEAEKKLAEMESVEE